MGKDDDLGLGEGLLGRVAPSDDALSDIAHAMDVARGAGVQVIAFTPAEPGAAAAH